MPRTRTSDKLERIVDAATHLLIGRGYRGTQIGDVAARAGVSAGTVYLYVQDKASLFDLVVRRALRDPGVDDVELPYAAAHPERMVDEVYSLVLERAGPALDTGPLHAERTDRPAEEFEEVVRSLYDWIFEHWRGLEIVERCAREWPELAALFYTQFRRRSLDLLARYLERRAAQGQLRSMPDSATAARVILENCAFFAMHRHIRPDSHMITDELAEETVVRVLVNAFVPEGGGG